MKKTLSIALIAVMVLATATLFSSCGNGSSSDDETFTIVLAHVEAEDRSTHEAAVKFKEYVEKNTDGKVTVEIHSNGELGGDTEITESVADGTIQMCLPSTSVFTAYDEQWGIMDMPFLFTQDAAFNAMDGELGEQLKNDTNEKSLGFTILGYMYNGPRSMTNSKHAIKVPSDCSGLKMRVMDSPVYISMFKALDASATPMSFSELYTALQQGTVDGEENPPTLIYASKFQEVQKYLSLTEHVHNFLGVCINTDFYNSLPDDYQKVIQEGSDKYLTEWQRDKELKDNETILQKLEDAGMNVNTVSDADHQKFVDAMDSVYKEYEEKWGADIFNLAKSYSK